MCTHMLLHLMSLTLFLFDGLVEHLLTKLCTQINNVSNLETELNQKEVYFLMTACGKNEPQLLLDKFVTNNSILKCFLGFSVGTDLTKSVSQLKARPNKKQNGLIHNFSYTRPSTETKIFYQKLLIIRTILHHM